jgi:hypothetical protein
MFESCTRSPSVADFDISGVNLLVLLPLRHLLSHALAYIRILSSYRMTSEFALAVRAHYNNRWEL